MSYQDLLRDPRWQRRRLEILNRDGFSCCLCNSNKRELHVHHKVYVTGRMPWDYAGDDLVTLCVVCHDSIEELKKSFGLLIHNRAFLEAYARFYNSFFASHSPQIPNKTKRKPATREEGSRYFQEMKKLISPHP